MRIHLIFMRRIVNRGIAVFLLASALAVIPSCKNIAKKASRETAEKAARNMAEGSVDKSLREIGQGAFKNMPWEAIIRALEKDNPVLARGVKALSRRFQSTLAERLAKDPALLRSLLSSRTILEEYKLFVKGNKKLLENEELFIWFAKSNYFARHLGSRNPLSEMALEQSGNSIRILDSQSSKVLGEMKNGIVTMNGAFKEGSSLLADDALIRMTLIPNHIYKAKGRNGLEYTYFVDELGRIKSVRCRNVSPDDLSANVLGLGRDVNLGVEGESAFRTLKQASRGDDLEVEIVYKYADESTTPSYVKVDCDVAGHNRVDETFRNIDMSAGKLFSAADNERLVRYYGERLGIPAEKQAKLLEELNADDELAALIHENPEFNIKRWVNTRNKPDPKKIARDKQGNLVKNGRDYAGNVFYFDPRLNRHLQDKLKNAPDGKYKGYTLEEYMELDRMFPNGVRYTEEGFPDFVGAGVCKPGKDGKPFIVEMPSGRFNPDRESDFKYARQVAHEIFGDSFSESDYIWHHIEGSPARLVLVRTQAHEACAHTGGHSLR